jgi:hypothetical protein
MMGAVPYCTLQYSFSVSSTMEDKLFFDGIDDCDHNSYNGSRAGYGRSHP